MNIPKTTGPTTKMGDRLYRFCACLWAHGSLRDGHFDAPVQAFLDTILGRNSVLLFTKDGNADIIFDASFARGAIDRLARLEIRMLLYSGEPAGSAKAATDILAPFYISFDEIDGRLAESAQLGAVEIEIHHIFRGLRLAGFLLYNFLLGGRHGNHPALVRRRDKWRCGPP